MHTDFNKLIYTPYYMVNHHTHVSQTTIPNTLLSFQHLQRATLRRGWPGVQIPSFIGTCDGSKILHTRNNPALYFFIQLDHYLNPLLTMIVQAMISFVTLANP